MATREVVRNHPSAPLNPPDESVIIPESVKRAAALAESFYAKPPETPNEPAAAVEPPPQETPTESTPEPVAPTPEAPAEPTPEPPPAPAPTHGDVPVPTKDDLTTDTWAGRYNSMRGRWEGAQRTIGEMQEQLSSLGDELLRTQRLIQGGSTKPRAPAPPARLVSQEEEDHYGKELIDLVQRAAAERIQPEIESLRQENSQLKNKVSRTEQLSVNQRLDAEVPDWRTVNRDPRWISWLRSPDVYSGTLRQNMLDEATKAADAPRVVAFFKGFLRESEATTGEAPPLSPQSQPASQPPRAPAVDLATLAAPGRPRPASGGTSSVPADKPVITHAQIRQFYSQEGRKAYEGRDADRKRDEQMIFSAQREGRIR